MGKLICLINDIDYSDEFISLQGLESTGPDVVGTATLLLRKTSGGLDLNPGMTVEVYEAFNDAGVGVKERGRYFGGFINMREGVGEMSSTFYTLNCVDNNILLDAITESVNNTLTVEAATFSDQILDIITTKQGAGGYLTRSIDAVSQVANITGASILPEIEFSHGETLREMIQKVCDNAILDNPAVEPRFFMHVGVDFGIGESVGYATLYIYDGALTPASSFHFKASALTNSGSDRPIYGQFRYKLDAAPTLITKLQSHWAGSSTATVEDAAAIAAYPNPYLSSGAWLAKPIEDTVSTTQAEAEAQLEAIISQTANPRRSIAFTSRQMVRPGEMVDITWPMEGITAQAYRVAGVSVLIPDNGDVACNITLDRMEMELGAPYVIGSSITTTGGGGHGTFTGLANPFNIESGTWTLINDASDTVGTFNGASLNSPTFLSTDTGSNVTGLSAQGVHSTGIAGGTVRGLEAGGYYYGTADVDTIMGINASANVFAPSTGDVDHIRAIEASVEHDGSGTVTDAAGLYVATPTTSDGPVTDAYGIYVEDQATGQTGEAWAAYLNGNTRITGYILSRNQGAFTTGANARAEESTGDPGWIVRGLNTEGTYMGNGTQGAVYGLTAYATTGWGTTGDVDNMTVMQAAIDHVGDGTITTAIGLHVLYPQTAAGDITTAYGIYVDNQDSGSVGTAWAGWFDGDVNITGNLNVGGFGGTAADPRIFNVKDYGAVGDGVADDTAEIQAAIDAAEAAGGGVVFFPAGVYIVGGALQDTSRSNAQLLLPRINLTGEQISITLRGEMPAPQVPTLVTSATTPDGGSVIKGTLNAGAGGALIGAWGPSGSYQDFTMITACFENLTIRMPANPVLTALNLSKVTAVQLNSVMVDTGEYVIDSVPEPTTNTSYGVRLPANNNGAWTRVRDTNVIGFYYGWGMGEHTNADGIGAWVCKYAAKFEAAYHASHIKRMLVVWCENGLTFTGGAHPLEIEQYDVEHWSGSPAEWYDPINDVVDASNYATGHIVWHAVLSGTGSHNSFVVSGGSNLHTRRLQDAISGSGSVATDTIWDAAGDLAVGTGANTAAKLSMGTALQQIRVNSGATALEYFTPSSSSGDMFKVVFDWGGDVALTYDGTIVTARA